jgi:proline iminopeptidase
MSAIDDKPFFDPEEAGLCPAPGGKVWYRINGKGHLTRGKTPLLCIHGGPGESHHYLLSLAVLAEHRPIIFYDQLDSGCSERPNDPSNWTVARFVDEVEAVRAHLGLEELHVLGSSWGGTVAAAYAARRPVGLKGLVLAGPLINTQRWIADCGAYRRRLPEGVQDTLDRHEAAGTVESEAYRAAIMVFYKRHFCRCEPWPWELERSFETVNRDLSIAMWGSAQLAATGVLKDYAGEEELSRIEAPTLFTCGEFDEATPTSCRYFAGLIPGARVEVLAGCSHMAHLENPDDYLALVRAFLDPLD